MRFVVKRSISDLGPDLFKVVDRRDGFRHVAIFTNELLARNCALRFEQAHVAHLFADAEKAS